MIVDSMNIDQVKAWLGKERCEALNAQTEGRFEKILQRVLRGAPDLPTAAVWTLQNCGSQPGHADLKRWSADVRALKEAEKKKRKS